VARPIVMSDLVLRCQRRANMEGEQFIGTPEWKALISEQYGHVYSTVVKQGMRHFESTQTISATGAASYALPSDHDQTIGIDRTLDAAGRKVDLGEMMIQERNAWSGQTGEAFAYSIVGQTIVFFPRPLTGTYTHTYVPQSPDISALSDDSTVDVVTADGEAFLINGVAVKALMKREQDPAYCMRERDAAEERFVEDTMLRALVNPRRRVVVSSPGDWGDDWGMNSDPGSWRWR
jgi:hypothetical protein